MFLLILSLALPSNVSYLEKLALVELANNSNLGVFISDLPQNHDLFQLLAVWKQKYTNIPNLGTAIISPFVYELEFLKKQIKTIFEISDSGFEIGLGLGDKKLLKKTINNRLIGFQEIIKQLIADSTIAGTHNQISIAGSGKKLIDFAVSKNLGLIYNGIITSDTLYSITSDKTRKNISSYIMVDVNDYNSLSTGFVSIVSRIITGLSNNELNRLQIDLKNVQDINLNLQKKNMENYMSWLPEQLIEKVAIFGSKEQIQEKLFSFEKLVFKQVILSVVGKGKKEELIEYLNRERF